jgi:hypothetical protein
MPAPYSEEGHGRLFAAGEFLEGHCGFVLDPGQDGWAVGGLADGRGTERQQVLGLVLRRELPRLKDELDQFVLAGVVDIAVREFDGLGRANVVAGTSKTFRSLARIAGAAPSAEGPYVKRELHASDLGIWTQRISAMSSEDRLHLPGVSEARAHQLLAGALVAEAALEMFKFKKLRICPWALREGLILRRLDQLVFAGPLEPAPHVAASRPVNAAV